MSVDEAYRVIAWFVAFIALMAIAFALDWWFRGRDR